MLTKTRIARVFPTKTSLSPTDRHAYFGIPDLFTPFYDEVHISVSFTWDKERAEWLKEQWESHAEIVKIGGPAIDGEPTNGFKAGMYLKKRVTITSRGCPNRCSWCFVNQDIIELEDFPEGNIVQDNNILTCSRNHLDKVFQMLSHQKQISFSGGLEPCRVSDQVVDKLRGLSIYQIWLAYDYPEAIMPLKKAVDKLRKYFRRDQIRCYVLIGYKEDSIPAALGRLRQAWELGTLPFAMRYRTPKTSWEDTYLFAGREWNLFTRRWTRPAIMKSMMSRVA